MPKVSVILTHQLDINRRFVERALYGLYEGLYKDFEVIFISGAESEPPAWTGPGKTHWDRSLDTATKKIHWGIEHSSGDFILLHSDDVILANTTIGELTEASTHHPSIMNPFSNSDSASLYIANFSLQQGGAGQVPRALRMTHDMSFEEVEGWEEEIIHFPLGRRIIVPTPTISFYCTMIPRVVWERVGQLDPALEYRHNDQDFCIRARQLGIPSVINLAPFAFHYGSQTLKHLASEAVRNEASQHFIRKYSQTQP